MVLKRRSIGCKDWKREVRESISEEDEEEEEDEEGGSLWIVRLEDVEVRVEWEGVI